MILGGAGPDRIDGGRGFDLVCAGRGADVVLGENGGDRVFGGAGDDRLYGGLQDDALSGEGGADLLIGGPAFNTLLGGSGDDYLRDGSTVDGGSGSDWISFADRTQWLANYGLASTFTQSNHRNIENVVGTRLRDVIYGLGTSGTVRGLGAPVFSGLPEFEQDQCHDFAHIDCGGPQWPGDQPIVLFDAALPDPGVVVMGGPGDDDLTISRSAAGVRVDSGGPIGALQDCRGGGTQSVTCPVPGPLGYVTAMTWEGNDKVTIEGNLGATVTIAVDGGIGADVLRGGAGDETLNSGLDSPYGVPGPDGQVYLEPTRDVVLGGGGDDSLSTGFAGPDRIYGGRGTDQLLSPFACGGGVLDGGPGRADIANFSPATNGVRAHLSGWAVTLVTPPADCHPTRLARGTEQLEGTAERDVLLGDRRSNSLIAGHQGEDLIRGLAGADHLLGEDGIDDLYGGPGADLLDCGKDGGFSDHAKNDRGAPGCGD